MHKLFFCLAFSCFFITESAMAVRTYSAFRVEVSGKGQPVILIPGATCSGQEWDQTVARYRDRFEMHVLTLAGYAGVPPLAKGPYLDSFRIQIEQYIRDNHLQKVILIGHSIGGFTSLRIATDDLPQIQKIIIVDAMPFFAAARNPSAQNGFNEDMAKSLYDRYDKMTDSAMFQSQLTVAKFLCNDSSYWKRIATWGVESDRRTMAYSMTEMLGHDIRPDLESIKVPVLVLAAFSASPQFPAYTREFALKTYMDQYDACATCSIVMPEGNTKHFIMFDNPKWYFSELDEFLLK